MRIKFEVPKKEPKVSIEAEVSEQQVKTVLAKLYQFIRTKFPFKIEVDRNGGTRQD